MESTFFGRNKNVQKDISKVSEFLEPVNKEIGQPDTFPSQAPGLIETSLTTRDKASTSLWFSEKFFLYYYDTDDVDHDYGDYYDDVHEPVMYSFRWIVIVMVIMLQNYKKDDWIFCDVLFCLFWQNRPKRKNFCYFDVHRVLWIISFDDSWRHITIHTDRSKYLGSKRVFKKPMIKYDDKRFISQLINMNFMRRNLTYLAPKIKWSKSG